MKFLLIFAALIALFVVSWPLALLALVLLPVFWLIALPFRIVGVVVGAILAFLKALLYLPARLLGGRAR